MCKDGYNNDCDTNWDYDTSGWGGKISPHGEIDCPLAVSTVTANQSTAYTNAGVSISCTISPSAAAGSNALFVYRDVDKSGAYSVGDVDCGWPAGSSWSGAAATFKNCNVGSVVGAVWFGCSVYSAASEPYDRAYQTGADTHVVVTAIAAPNCNQPTKALCEAQQTPLEDCVWVDPCSPEGKLRTPNSCLLEPGSYTEACSIASCGAVCDGSITNCDLSSCTCPAYTYRSGNACIPYVCTGTDPSSATLCPSDGVNLLANATKTLVAACSSPAGSVPKCEYTCNADKTFNGTACVAMCTGPIPGNATIFAGDDIGLTVNVARTLKTLNTAAKCEYKCDSGYYYSAGVCLPYVCFGPIPENATLFLGDDVGLTVNVARTLKTSNTAAKCEYSCSPGYDYLDPPLGLPYCRYLCGNGVVNAPEQCDNGANNGVCPKTCSNTCRTNFCSENCSNMTDDDANGLIDEAQIGCGIILTVTPNAVVGRASVRANVTASDGVLNVGAAGKNICDASGCVAGTSVGACAGSVVCAGTTDCVFTAPANEGGYTYWACVGNNSAQATLSVTSTNYCGDGTIQPGEECDLSNWGPITNCSGLDLFTGGTLSCDQECFFNTSGCTGVAGGSCGDNIIQVGEDCDGTNFGPITACWNLDGFTGGTLSCIATGTHRCHFNTSACTTTPPECGNSNREIGEECELNNTVNNAYCVETTSQCVGRKNQTRAPLGNCDAACGCVNQTWGELKCIQGSCGATANETSDCNPATQDYNPATCSCDSRLGNLTGFVRGIVNGNPVPLVHASVRTIDASVPLTYTDANGEFLVADIPEGTRSVVASYDAGYSPQTKVVTIVADETTFVEFTLDDGNCEGCADWNNYCTQKCSHTQFCNVTVPAACTDALNPAKAGEWVWDETANGGAGAYILCCEGGQEKRALPLSAVQGCMADLVQFTRVVYYAGQPVTMHIYTWKPCS